MLASQLITKIRRRINDANTTTPEFEDDELMDYINDAITDLSMNLINDNAAEMINTVNIPDGFPVPTSCVKLAGIYPIREEGTLWRITNGAAMVLIRYFATRPLISAVGDTIPFKDMYLTALADEVCKRAMNRVEADTTQETQYQLKHLTALNAAKTG